ncbi:MAG: glycosyltransferase family 2 protein [Chloroflexota bacterium]|nr:MAG: glycosyltransferase family 2 protein [Chloroflexota bacterium]
MGQRSPRILSNSSATLSIVIISWNVRELLSGCLDSVQSNLLANPDLVTETFVVDNASTDGSQEMVRCEYPWVRLIENTENVGFAQANNQAIQMSCGQYVLLLNPDTEASPGALRALLDSLANLPGAGMAGARLLNDDGSLQVSCYREPTLLREFLLMFHLDGFLSYGSYRMKSWPLDRPREVDTVMGACMLIRKSVLESIGLMDQGYFMYSEEVDLCYRIRRAGWRIYWVPQAKVVHFGGQSTQQVAT